MPPLLRVAGRDLPKSAFTAGTVRVDGLSVGVVMRWVAGWAGVGETSRAESRSVRNSGEPFLVAAVSTGCERDCGAHGAACET